MGKLNRRRFLAASAGAMGAAALCPHLRAQSHPDLAVATGEDPAAITRAAVLALGGMERFVSSGNTVLVKPNIGWDRLPTQAANTNPDVVAAVVRLCTEAGAARVLVMDNTLNDPRRCYTRSGIAEAAAAAGAQTPFMNVRRFEMTDTVSEGSIGVLGNWPVYSDAVEVDVLINVPIAKHHSLSRLSLGMKNLYGLIGGPRHRLHQRLDEGIVDLTAFFRPQLTILDAWRILVRNGPQGGRRTDTEMRNQVIAGTDPVAVDAYGATLFGLEPADLGFVRIGAERGLGTHDLGSLDISRVTA